MADEPEIYSRGDLIDGRYRVVNALGGGGFATVYRVFDTLEEAYWALKLFKRIADPDSVKREINILRRIQHPNVMKVYHLDRSDDGRWYMISEILEGEVLEDYAHGERLPDEAIAQVGVELLEALIAIHPDEKGIQELESEPELSYEQLNELLELRDGGFVHRDIKPSNLILTGEGLKLLDFNIASRVGANVDTRSRTLEFVPPDADWTVWTTDVDLFATGVTLYELLCGNHPYPSSIPQRGKGPIDPTRFRKDVSSDVCAFLLRACAETKEDRFRSAREMLDAWEPCAHQLNPSMAVDTEPGQVLAHSESRRKHVARPGGSDDMTVKPDELKELGDLGAGWPAVMTCDASGVAWPTFGDREDMTARSELLREVVAVILRERPVGGRFQVSEEGVFMWSLRRLVVRFVANEGLDG